MQITRTKSSEMFYLFLWPAVKTLDPFKNTGSEQKMPTPTPSILALGAILTRVPSCEWILWHVCVVLVMPKTGCFLANADNMIEHQSKPDSLKLSGSGQTLQMCGTAPPLDMWQNHRDRWCLLLCAGSHPAQLRARSFVWLETTQEIQWTYSTHLQGGKMPEINNWLITKNCEVRWKHSWAEWRVDFIYDSIHWRDKKQIKIRWTHSQPVTTNQHEPNRQGWKYTSYT